MKKPVSILLVSTVTAFVLLSCQLITPTATSMPAATNEPVPSLAPTSEPIPTETAKAVTTPLPAVTPVVTASAVNPVVEVRNSHQEGDNPKYTIDIAYPYLVSPEGPAFNHAVEDITKRVVTAFKDNASSYPTIDDPNLTSYNSVNIYTTLHQQDSHILSVYLEISEYYRGAAHPSPSSAVVNYSFDRGQVLSLADLFAPGADYLKVISDYCIQDLQGKDFFNFPEGADPKAENYRVWNLTSDGLLITFDPYQVAPYAAGFVRVTIPYTVLQPYLDPSSPIAYLYKQ